MYTSVDHPDDGRELQIKTGSDLCNRYKLGDKLPWKPDPYWPGYHIDGAYASYGIKGVDDWVIIKDCTIVAVEARGCGLESSQLEHKYGIEPPDPSLWKPEDWHAKADREAKIEAEYAEYVRTHGGVSNVATAAGYFMHKKLTERSMASLLFPMNKIRAHND